MRRVQALKEAAIATGLSEYELRTGAKSGRYPAYRAGGPNGKFLFDVELLEESITRLMLENTLSAAETQQPGTIRPIRIAK